MSQSSYKTLALQQRNYKIYQIILKTLGLWPYQQTYLTWLHKIFFAGILLTSLFVQLLVFVTKQYSIDLLLKILSFFFPIIFVTIKYLVFIIQEDDLKILLEQIQNDWNSLQDELEIDIMEKYACNMRLFTIATMAYCHISIFFYIFFDLLPLILNVVLPLNESRPFQLLILAEYFVNQERYGRYLILHEILTGYITMNTLCGIGVIIVMYIMHACALFKIASYRIENAIEKCILMIPSPRRKYLLCEKIIHAIVIHQRAIQYTNFVISTYTTLLTTLIIVGVCSLSISLFQTFQLIILMNNIRAITVATMITFCHLSYMFVLNYAGQELINHGLHFFKASYNGLWYAASMHTQKLLLFIMQRGTINTVFICGKMYVASLEGFASLTSMAVSYFTVMYSTR